MQWKGSLESFFSTKEHIFLMLQRNTQPRLFKKLHQNNIWRVINLVLLFNAIVCSSIHPFNYLLFEAHSFQWASLLENCFLLGRGHVRRKIHDCKYIKIIYQSMFLYCIPLSHHWYPRYPKQNPGGGYKVLVSVAQQPCPLQYIHIQWYLHLKSMKKY